MKNDTFGIFKPKVTEAQAQGWLKFSQMTPWDFQALRDRGAGSRLVEILKNDTPGFPNVFGAHLGPMRGPILVWGPSGSHWGPIWRPKADITEAEGRLKGGLGTAVHVASKVGRT